ncbi:MAG: ferritin family protein [Desulfurococcaceae archaeon]
MLSKNPIDLSSNKKLSKEEIKDALRLSMMAELDAVSLYLQIARSIDDEKIRKVFEDVAKEEKTHVGEFLAVLRSLDEEQAEELARGEKEVEGLTGAYSHNFDQKVESNEKQSKHH